MGKELERRPRLAALCSVVAGGITDLRVDTVVSPANSFGFMRGGVDGVYTRVFGEGVESRLQAIIRTLPAEELPGRGSSHRAYRTFGYPVADLRADHAQAFRAS